MPEILGNACQPKRKNGNFLKITGFGYDFEDAVGRCGGTAFDGFGVFSLPFSMKNHHLMVQHVSDSIKKHLLVKYLVRKLSESVGAMYTARMLQNPKNPGWLQASF